MQTEFNTRVQDLFLQSGGGQQYHVRAESCQLYSLNLHLGLLPHFPLRHDHQTLNLAFT